MSRLTADSDAVRRYQCDAAQDARIMTVRLDQITHPMLDHQGLPDPVNRLCQELAAAACLLTNILKFDGDMILQTRSNGPVRMLMAECSSTGRVRTTAQWEGAIDGLDFDALLGQGYLAVTVEPEQGERYQGIVDIAKGSLSASLNQYFVNSEQLDTHIWLAADGKAAGGLLVQRLPSDGGHAHQNAWETLETLAHTVTDPELCADAGPRLAYRLFAELDPRELPAWPVHFGCTCSRERSARAIRALGDDAVMALFEEQPTLRLDCHFCGQHYQYDQADIEWLLSDQPPGSDTLQ